MHDFRCRAPAIIGWRTIPIYACWACTGSVEGSSDMERVLSATDVATAIRETLGGRNTKAQLGKWAHLAMLADDAKTMPYDYRQVSEINAAVHRLIMMAEGPDYELDDTELRAMMEHLDALTSSQHML
jgi:hypothetical protein